MTKITTATPVQRVMEAERAAWVRDHAWQVHHRKTHTEYPSVHGACGCQGGQCGHCAAGRHRDCTHEQNPPHVGPATYLTCRRGYVLAEVWEARHGHAWTCACKKAGHDGTPIQEALF